MVERQRNIYETGSNLDSGSDKLRCFDIPSQFSTSLLDEILGGETLLDIGKYLDRFN